MRRGPINIPYEIAYRAIEHLKGEPEYKELQQERRNHIWAANSLSLLLYAYHFESINEFLEYEPQLKGKISPVAFERVTVRDKVEGKNGLEITLGDQTNSTLVLEYAGTNDPITDPLTASEVGDTLQIYTSSYFGNSRIKVDAGIHVRNDDHYARLQEMRAELVDKL